jgi:hypothetical protein
MGQAPAGLETRKNSPAHEGIRARQWQDDDKKNAGLLTRRNLLILLKRLGRSVA